MSCLKQAFCFLFGFKLVASCNLIPGSETDLSFKIHKVGLKPSLFSQWSLIRSFVRDFFCISFVWLCSQREVSQTKLMQTKSRTKLYTRLHWLEWLGFRLNKTIVIKPPKDIWPNDCQKTLLPLLSYCCCSLLLCKTCLSKE